MSYAAVFPGQGSQSTGMLSALAEAYPVVRDTFAEASDALGYDLAALIRDNPEGRLDRTEYTQPALLAAGVAAWRAWRSEGGPDPVALAGHSLGEYTALVAAEALDFPVALRLVRERGRLMQAAVPEGSGAMAAVLGLDDTAVIALCEALAPGVEAVNFNAPGQVVIAGLREKVAAVAERAAQAGAKRVVMLPVSVPSHSSLMREAAERLAEHVHAAGLRPPRWPVLHNVDARPRAEAGAIAEALVRQLHQPVRWTDSVRALAAEGVDALVEFGPGRVLSGLCRRIDRSLKAYPVEDPQTLQTALDNLGV
ncbi:MAG: malonyl CoA-acyl carrier protein transacylase [Gammaproteobacteria bacterium]|nr:MAG: malonyl CoA-acyl carrier protein transacylase [Gammaproteobacteria bacterium]